MLSFHYSHRTVAFTVDQDCVVVAPGGSGQSNDLPLLALTQQLENDLLTAAPSLKVR